MPRPCGQGHNGHALPVHWHLSLGSGPAQGSKNWPGWGGGHRHAQTLPLLTCPVPCFFPSFPDGLDWFSHPPSLPGPKASPHAGLPGLCFLFNKKKCF